MNLHLLRTDFTESSTIGELSIDGVFFCFTLEDKDRGLNSTMAISELNNKKIPGQTAIPTGRYEIVFSYSNRFHTPLPLLLHVPVFDAIRIHNGNFSSHTEGCILVGSAKASNMVQNSKVTLSKLLPILQNALNKEKIFIEIGRKNYI